MNTAISARNGCLSSCVLLGDSNVTMAPFRGNRLGTASIEVLTLQSVADIWQPYAQEVLDKWMALRNRPEWKDQKLNIRPSLGEGVVSPSALC